LAFSIIASFVTSIVVANAIGPERLGPFNYVVWLTNITTAVDGFGLPATTRKYMAEHLNRGEDGIAHAIYRFSLRLQCLVAGALLAVAIALIFTIGDPGYHAIGVFLALNMAPRMVGFIPSQANAAKEMMRWNTTPAVVGVAINVAVTLFSIWIGWGLRGVACSLTLAAFVETAMKLRTVHRWLGPTPIDEIPPALKRRLFSYSGQGLVLMLLNVVVWDRSDMLILRAMNHDLRQITFFSIAFNLTDRLLKLPEAFGSSLTVTMMAQYGRAREGLRQLTLGGAKYTFLIAFPMLVGMAALSRQFVNVLYVPEYQPLIPVLMAAALLAIPRAVMAPATSLLQATEDQGYLIWVGCVCGAVDIGLDFWLTPTRGALGATLANGVAQTLAVIAVWARVHRIYPMGELFSALARIGISGTVMAAVVIFTGRQLHGYSGVAISLIAGALTWFVALRLTHALDQSDRERFQHIAKALPPRVRPIYSRVVELLT
jgi:O-antigen/teichoic acid export membrane protein